MDRPVTQTFPAEPAREPVPSGAPRVGQPPAMGWFILAILGIGFLLCSKAPETLSLASAERRTRVGRFVIRILREACLHSSLTRTSVA